MADLGGLVFSHRMEVLLCFLRKSIKMREFFLKIVFIVFIYSSYYQVKYVEEQNVAFIHIIILGKDKRFLTKCLLPPGYPGNENKV